jgi:hypothetical protein
MTLFVQGVYQEEKTSGVQNSGKNSQNDLRLSVIQTRLMESPDVIYSIGMLRSSYCTFRGISFSKRNKYGFLVVLGNSTITSVIIDFHKLFLSCKWDKV